MDEITGVQIRETWTLEKIRNGHVYETIAYDEDGNRTVHTEGSDPHPADQRR